MVDRPLEAGASRRWVMLPVVALIYVFPGGVMRLVKSRGTPAADDDVAMASTIEARR